jgi:hypothetical protein
MQLDKCLGLFDEEAEDPEWMLKEYLPSWISKQN